MRSSQTLSSKEKAFKWEYNHFGLTIYRTFSNGSEVKTRFTNNEIEQLVSYFFGHEVVYLANNIEKLSGGTEVDGLGRFAYEVLKKSILDAQAVSQLAAIFVETGLCTNVGSGRPIKLKFMKRLWQECLD